MAPRDRSSSVPLGLGAASGGNGSAAPPTALFHSLMVAAYQPPAPTCAHTTWEME